MEYLPYIAIATLAASMFFALLSNALRWYSMARLEERLSELGRMDELVKFLAHEDDHVMAAAAWRLVVNTVFVVAMSLQIRVLGPGSALLIAALSALGLLIFGVGVPMAWAKYNSEGVIARTMPVIFGLRWLSLPLLAFLRLFDAVVRRLSGVTETQADRNDNLADELLSVVREGELEGTLQEQEKEMIESIIGFKHDDVSQVMTPRTDMACLAHDATLSEARVFIMDEGHSRVPIYRDTLDTIVGILYAKDLLAATALMDVDQKKAGDIMRDAFFVPETKKLTDLLRDFKQEGVHMAIVLDEYGGTAGVVTIEDVIEEIVGDIADEYDEQEEPLEIRSLSPTSAEVGARAHISEVNSELGLALPENEDYETIGGFVLAKLGYIPKTGERLEHRGLKITVLEASQRKIGRLRIEGLDQYTAPREQ